MEQWQPRQPTLSSDNILEVEEEKEIVEACVQSPFGGVSGYVDY